MGIYLKSLFRVAIAITIGLVLSMAAERDIRRMYSIPTYNQVTSLDNNSHHVLVSNQKKIIERSRSSAVRILSLSIENGGVASSSGTYIEMYGHHYVITTNHGILGNCENTKIVVDDISYDCLNFVELNDEVDYALIQIEEIEHRNAVKIPQKIARTNKEWMKALSVMSTTYYTGFPNGMGPLTIDGKIMGHSREGYIYMNSYAWSGSSGSGVFSQSGDYIGYVIAIDVGPGFAGPTVLENVVLVVPAYRINWASAADMLLRRLSESQDTANYSDTNSED